MTDSKILTSDLIKKKILFLCQQKYLRVHKRECGRTTSAAEYIVRR